MLGLARPADVTPRADRRPIDVQASERRETTWGVLARSAARRHGLLTRAEILTVLTEEQLAHRLLSRRLEPVRRGVYRVTGAPETWEQHLLAICLSVPTSVASFRCAAALHRLEGFPREPFEITIGARRRARVAGVTVHDSAVTGPMHLATVGGIPVTSVARTLCDLTAVVSARTVERAVDEALRRRLVTIARLAEVFADIGGPGRRRSTVMRGILDRRSGGWEPGESDPEERVARLLVRAGLPRPVHQHRVVVGYRTARIDLAYPAQRIAIEYDGWDVHSTRSAFDDDRRRANDLVVHGWTVLRFTSMSSDDTIIDTVRAAHARASVTGPGDGPLK